MTLEKIRLNISRVYWKLKEDFEQIEEKELFYDVGLMIGYCYSINKKDLGDKIYDKFIPN